MRSEPLRRLVIAVLFLAGLTVEAAGLDGCLHHELGASSTMGAPAEAQHRAHNSTESSSGPHEDHSEGGPCCCIDQCECVFDPSRSNVAPLRAEVPGIRPITVRPAAVGTPGTSRPYLQPPANASPHR